MVGDGLVWVGSCVPAALPLLVRATGEVVDIS